MRFMHAKDTRARVLICVRSVYLVRIKRPLIIAGGTSRLECALDFLTTSHNAGATGQLHIQRGDSREARKKSCFTLYTISDCWVESGKFACTIYGSLSILHGGKRKVAKKQQGLKHSNYYRLLWTMEEKYCICGRWWGMVHYMLYVIYFYF